MEKKRTAVVSSRKCYECRKPLTSKRARKKYCYHCEVAVRKIQKQQAHDRRVEKVYGLLPGDYALLYAAQGGRCAIFGCKARGLKIALAVEHDHLLGFTRLAVRGLTCKRHNAMIAFAGDDPRVFDSLAEYLRNPPARGVLCGSS